MQRSCDLLGIELIEGPYDYQSWLDAVRGLEKEPEKGKRCAVCFDKRFLVSAHKALELGEKKITTTLLVSPLKSQEQLKAIGEKFYTEYGVEFIAVDYRSGGGTQDQSRVTKEQQLYRQDYCGCIYGLTMQREQQNKLLDELFSPISQQILPGSIEERIALYTTRNELEKQKKNYKIIKEKFLNYREFFCTLYKNKTTQVTAYPLPYSTLPRKKAQGRIEYTINNISYCNRDEIKCITLEYFNTLTSFHYKSVQELIFNPPLFEEVLKIRHHITQSPYDLSPILVIEEPLDGKLILHLDTKVYEDTREKLIII